jgi:predicted N-acyltransferase
LIFGTGAQLMQARFINRIDEIPEQEWNRLVTDDNPFLTHAFLAALEHQGAVGALTGWQPHHLLVEDGTTLRGAAPLYIKSHSYGEFVFDWLWASAYERAGIPYYPKLVIAVPYTPVTGPRLLTGAAAPDSDDIVDLLLRSITDFAAETGLSSVHYLFINALDKRRLDRRDLLPRYGCQFHWFNRDYDTFEDFLATLNARHRKKIRHERRRIAQQGLSIITLHGDQVSRAQWRFFHHCYQSTFDKKANVAPLTTEFFCEIGERLGRRVILVLAMHEDAPVAGALFLRSHDALFGRYWGCVRNFDCLHFELCYYQAIDYCITHGLNRCEAGAQGDHKIGRGFAPVSTCSAHWIAAPEFRDVIRQFVRHEKSGVEEYMAEMDTHLPYRRNETGREET